MQTSALALLAVFAIAEARVNFPFSEVLQKSDLKLDGTPFACDDGCTVYVDAPTDALFVADGDDFFANFTEIVNADGGLELTPSPNYTVQYRDSANVDFVFYSVSVNAPNRGSPVVASLDDIGATVSGKGRYLTVLSSAVAINANGFRGDFPVNYPKVYATGFDALGDQYDFTQCTAVYSARSQWLAEKSSPIFFSPVITIDFGWEYDHSVTVRTTDGSTYPKSDVSSVVYMSPGFIGCPFVFNQKYDSTVTKVEDKFTVLESSVDIAATWFGLTINEAVHLRVNYDTLDFPIAGLIDSNLPKHYDQGAYNVDLSWNRKTTTSAWTLQIDLGKATPPPTSTVPTTTGPTTSVEITTVSTTSVPPPPPSTTTSGAALSMLLAVAAVIVTVA